MPREKVGFREQLEHLSELFPGRESLGIDEVCKLLGLSRDTLLAAETLMLSTLLSLGTLPVWAVILTHIYHLG